MKQNRIRVIVTLWYGKSRRSGKAVIGSHHYWGLNLKQADNYPLYKIKLPTCQKDMELQKKVASAKTIAGFCSRSGHLYYIFVSLRGDGLHLYQFFVFHIGFI
jgi:hypothetical protein